MDMPYKRDAHTVRMDGIDTRLENHSDIHDELWSAITSLQNRLPLWATLLIGFLASICGGTITLLGNIAINR